MSDAILMRKGENFMGIEEYIILAIVGSIVFIPAVAWRLYKRYRYSENVKNIVSKPFVCPDCGHRFYTQQKVIRIVGENKAYLKCPSCGKSNLCGRPYDFDN